MQKPDALIFDMDGTLWDASSTYLKAWNLAFKALNIHKIISETTLNGMMGWEKRKVFDQIFPELSIEKQDEIAALIEQKQDEILPIYGGKLYKGVQNGLVALAEKYKIFIVSNCPANTINQMMKFTKIDHIITDTFAHGTNFMPKHNNIRLLIKKYKLKNPIYIGDTEGDKIQAELTPLPFVYVSYGFGKSSGILNFESFDNFSAYFLTL